MSELQLAMVVAGLVLVILLVAVLLVTKLRRRVNRGVALVIHRVGGADVSFSDRVVIPVLQRAETIDLTVQTIEVDCRGKHGVVCHDNIRADITLTYYIHVNRTAEDVLKVADSIGCARAPTSYVSRSGSRSPNRTSMPTKQWPASNKCAPRSKRARARPFTPDSSADRPAANDDLMTV